MSYQRVTRSLAAIALLSMPLAASAETVQDLCIDTGGNLRLAFESINTSEEAGNQADRYRLHLVSGNYFPPALPSLGSPGSPAPSVELLGGYDPGCATQSTTPTTLNLARAGDLLPLLDIEAGADVRIERLVLTPSGPMTAANHLVRIRQSEGALRRARWTVARSEFRGKADENDASPPIAAMDLRVGAADTPPVTVHIENSVIKGFDPSGCALQYTEFSPAIPLAGQELEVVNSTIAYNDTCGISASGLERTTRVVLANDIIGLNVGPGLQTTGDAESQVELHNNMMPAANDIASTVVIDRHNSNANALLNSYALPFPTSASAAVNSGTTYLPGGVQELDLLGFPRWQGSHPDRGAIETLIDDLTVHVVTNANNAGLGSLRDALGDAGQSPGPDKIVFNIIDAQGQPECPALINLDSSIPMAGVVRIDGFTQPGSRPNSMQQGSDAIYCVFVSGGGQNINGLATSSQSSTLLDVRGLAFGGFGDMTKAFNAVISTSSAEEVSLRGNHFGAGLPNAPAGVSSSELGAEFVNPNGFVTIGGVSAADRNHFSGNKYSMSISGAQLELLNNYVGANRAGDGRAQPGQLTDTILYENPKISFRAESNIFLGEFNLRRTTDFSRMTGGSIRKNVFGAGVACLDDPQADCLLPANGPFVSMRVNNGVNGVGTVRGLHLEENVFAGIIDVGLANGLGFQPREVALSGNLFRGNRAFLTIESALAAANSKNFDNDVAPAREADSNRGQNFPVINTASGFAGAGQATGSLSTRSGTYVIDVFASNKCFNEFPDYAHGDETERVGIGSVTVVDNGVTNGTAAFQIPLHSRLGLTGRFLYASATDQDGNSSEFSYRNSGSPCANYELQLGPEVIFRDGFED